MFRTIPLQAALIAEVFCFLHVDLLPPFLRTYDCSALPGFPVLWPLLTSHDSSLLWFGSQLLTAVTGLTAFFPPNPLVRPPRVLTRSFPLLPAMFTANDSVQLLGFGLVSSLTLAYGLT